MKMIGIVVPVYNVEKYITKCIESIITQSYSDFTLVLVDDGSPDLSGKICDSYASKDKRIKVIHQVNGGLSAARNAGIDWIEQNTDCEWITFIDSDDWVHPDYLQRMFEIAVNKEVNLVLCDFLRTSEENVSFMLENQKETLCTPEDYWVENPINASIACAKLINLKLFHSVRFPIGRIHEDEFTMYKILFACSRVVYIAEKLYLYRYNPNSITLSTWNPARLVIFDAFEEQIKFFKENGYNRAYQERINVCIENYCIQLYKMEQSATNYGKLRKKVLKDYRLQLWKYRYELPFYKNIDKYGIAYPVIGWSVCIFRKVFDFIK